DGHPEHRGSTTEHFLVGVGSILVGTNTAAYRTWDGIRGIDYLCERKDIDPKKIGCTGCSGGGTLTSYIMALDERVYCAAPACYLTTLEKLIDTIGPQDAEQNIHAQIAFGMDQTDYVLMRAPKPTLICCTTDDFFNIEGTWDTFRQSKRFYAKFGQPEQVNLVESAGKHGVTKTGREAIGRWMQRWLLGIDKDITDPGSKTWSVEDLQCTPKGQVLLIEGEKSVFDLNGERARIFAPRRKGFAGLPLDLARNRVRRVAGIRKLEDIPLASFRTVGQARSEDFEIRKLVMVADDGVSLPILRVIPKHSKGGLTLFLSGTHKEKVLGNDLVQEAIHDGREIWALDLRGIGELRHPSSNNQLGDWKTFYLSYLLEQSLVGRRTEDVINCARSVLMMEDRKMKPIEIIATDEA
ncbi:MAG: prolyl oligopeptidase family serine peptidase, partial [Planctomycetaceae bacterium]|nr:prolyl oligopeptidase family serine peptidase [Planctomycetaceae bacterium]